MPEILRTLKDRDVERARSALELIGGFSGRKHAVVAIMLAQSWMRSVVSSTTIRNLIPASMVFRMRSDEARAMTGLRANYWTADPMDLEPGMFYAVGIDSGAVKVRVPALPPTRTRAREPLRLNRSGHFAATSPGALPKWERSTSEVALEVESEVASALPEELPESQVVTLLRKAYSPSRVVRELTGLSGGDRYQRLTQALSRWLVAKALGPEAENQ